MLYEVITALDRLLAPLEGRTDVVVLPEMFTSGFTMAPAPIAELPNGDTPTWLADQAARLGAAVTGSIVNMASVAGLGGTGGGAAYISYNFV